MKQTHFKFFECFRQPKKGTRAFKIQNYPSFTEECWRELANVMITRETGTILNNKDMCLVPGLEVKGQKGESKEWRERRKRRETERKREEIERENMREDARRKRQTNRDTGCRPDKRPRVENVGQSGEKEVSSASTKIVRQNVRDTSTHEGANKRKREETHHIEDIQPVDTHTHSHEVKIKFKGGNSSRDKHTCEEQPQPKPGKTTSLKPISPPQKT